MGQVLHGSATTTEAIRRAIQHSKESLRTLAQRYGVNPKTVAKWRKRELPSRICRPVPKSQNPRPSQSRTKHRRRVSQTYIAAARRLPLCPPGADTSSDPLAAYRCLQRHGISRLPDVEDGKGIKRKFKIYPIGYFHIDIAEVRTAEGTPRRHSRQNAPGLFPRF